MTTVPQKRTLFESDVERRDPNNGPYGIFITVSQGKSITAHENLIHSYCEIWSGITDSMLALLWGSSRERADAMNMVQKQNSKLRDINSKSGRQRNMGLIDYQDWVQAGRQLDLAIRDYYIYNSDARYYDVEDFIWERTQKRHYPDSWRVEWKRYQREIERNSSKYNDGNCYALNRCRHQRATAIRGQQKAVACSAPRPTKRRAKADHKLTPIR
ncbi:hypothetical protein AJ80_09951 [Polytolypa hystricis UAMH7299]|uniref:Uncharacterized protein n=1 Tax=Polytolypa hystricis (strain UAMH7299) TaxID=1447883 RepID=A0A2B7WFN1_POLH7|nr:hypothetical protein AJ80_09951 [Polytolypa hystricis UAMH7299]